MKYSSTYFGLPELYVAYRKAKVEAFHESTHFHAEAFTVYEQKLDANLRQLLERLNDAGAAWTTDQELLGSYDYAPKSIEDPLPDDVHFRDLDPVEDWVRRSQSRNEKTKASFRLLIVPTVDFQVISSLWVMKVGHRYDRCLDPRHSYGNRLRLQTRAEDLDQVLDPGVNLDCQGLFRPYFSAYRDWRERGLSAMRAAIEKGQPAVAVTMDIRQFYHRASPSFLLRRSFLSRIKLELDREDRRFTRDVLTAIESWYRNTPDYDDRPEGGLPVGLSASKVIANVLLAEFDRLLVEGVKPLYYGRYVDDIFLVFSPTEKLSSATEVMKWIADHSLSSLIYRRTAELGEFLRLSLPYASDSELIFVGAKQKVFSLTSKHGLDLIEQIEEQIRAQSSEYRLLPDLPETDVEMASRALLAVPDTTLEADSLRKTEAVSIRRLGFSLLLRDVEAFARDLEPRRWEKLRLQFYGLVERHLLTPRGFFDFSGYLHRVFGLMVSSGDYDAAKSFLERFQQIVDLIRRTSTAGSTDNHKYASCVDHYARGFIQAAMQASSSKRISIEDEFMSVLRRLRAIAPKVAIPRTRKTAARMSVQMLLSDWGRRPYKDYWYFSQSADIKGPPVPSERAIRKVLRLGGIRPFRRGTFLRVPHWPALAFPTRPMTVAEISLVSPGVLEDDYRFRRAVLSLRGAHASSGRKIGLSGSDIPHLHVPKRQEAVRVALTNIETSPQQWLQAAKLRPDLSLQRYLGLNRLMNQVMKDAGKPNYIVLPECSIPKKWALSIAAKLAQSGMSLLAGLEYQRDRKSKGLRNDCLVSLATDWPYYVTNVLRLQSKLQPAHGERAGLKKLKETMHVPSGHEEVLPVYVHGRFCFGVLLCSDLTNIKNRQHFQGSIDALFVLEWNQDINTFGFLVESSAHDIHTFVVQVNNRTYGDSRVRTPLEATYLRDAVRLKGGVTDYFVIAEIDAEPLRRFQAGGGKAGSAFKPLPIGFEMSELRRAMSH